jgi:hypothetical protein
MTYKGSLMVIDDLLLQGLRNASRLVPLVWFMQRMVMLLPRDNNGSLSSGYLVKKGHALL